MVGTLRFAHPTTDAFFVIARSDSDEAIRIRRRDGLLRFALDDGDYDAATFRERSAPVTANPSYPFAATSLQICRYGPTPPI